MTSPTINTELAPEFVEPEGKEPEVDRVKLPEIPDLSMHPKLNHEDLMLGMEVLAYRVVIDTRTGLVMEIPRGHVIHGIITSVPTAKDPREFVTVDFRPGVLVNGQRAKQPPALAPLHGIRDGELIREGRLLLPYELVVMQFHRHVEDSEEERLRRVHERIRRLRTRGRFVLGAHDEAGH